MSVHGIGSAQDLCSSDQCITNAIDVLLNNFANCTHTSLGHELFKIVLSKPPKGRLMRFFSNCHSNRNPGLFVFGWGISPLTLCF